MISALIEADPDPRAVARAVLVRFLDAPRDRQSCHAVLVCFLDARRTGVMPKPGQ